MEIISNARELFIVEIIINYLQTTYPLIYGDSTIVKNYIQYNKLNNKKNLSEINKQIKLTDEENEKLDELNTFFFGNENGTSSAYSDLPGNYLMVIRTIKELIKSNNNAIKDIIDNVYSLFDNKEITENNEVLGVFLDNIIIPSLSSSFSDNYVDDKIETKISREEHKFDKYQQLNDEEVERIEKKRIEAEIKKKEDEKKLEEKKKIAIAKKKEKEELNQKIKEEYEKTTYKDINEKFDNIIFEITSNIPGIDKNKLNNCVDELSKEQDKYIKSILLNFCELMKIKNKFNNISELSNSDINKLLKNFNSKSKELSKITSQYSKEFINKNIVIIDEFFKSNEYLEFITQYNPFEKLYSLINKFINIRKEIIIYYLYNQDILDVNNWLDNKSSSSTLNTNQLQISNAISVAPAAGVDVAAAPAAAAPAAGVDVAALSPMPFSLPVAVAAAAAAAPAAGIFVSPVALADGAAPFAPVVDAVLSTPRVFLSPLVSLPQPIPLDGVDVAADADAGVADHHVQHLAAVLDLAHDRQAHFAAFGELEGVGQQVRGDLAQSAGVAAAAPGGALVQVRHQLEAPPRGRLAVGRLRIMDDVGQFELGQLQLHLAGLDLGQVEHVVQNGQQGFAGLAHDAQPLALNVAQLAHVHDLGHGQDPVQRRADLVAHVGQELRLQDIGGLGGVARLDQFVHGLVQGLVVGAQLAQQAVEGVGQPPQLILGDRLDHLGEIAAVGNAVHRGGQATHRLNNPPGQPSGQKQGERGRAEEQRAGG